MQTMTASSALYSPSPLRGEGRVRGQVSESPRDYARGLRRRQTDAERRLWARLRDRRLLGHKFARQVPIGPYIVDLCCRERKLVVELDGGQHTVQLVYDADRTAVLTERGYRVLRFWDNDVLANTDGVLHCIAQALAGPSPRPSPQRGEGEKGHQHPRPSGPVLPLPSGERAG
ncbi:MAG TPA: endonuclease domain-containing protein [Methylomirabilota bacterium]|nr:endonuclease domain-containing protein [Methylomirabilota bacterium]